MKVFKFLIIGVIAFVVFLSLPFFNAIFTSVLLSFLMKPVYNKLNKVIKNNSLSALILTIVSTSCFSILIYLLIRVLIFSFIQIQSLLDINIQFLNELLSNMGFTLLLQANNFNILNLIELFYTNAPKTLLDLFLVLFLVFYLLRDSHKLNKFIRGFLSENNEKDFNFFIKRSNIILKSILLESFFVALIMGFTTFTSLSVLGVSHSLEFASLSFGMSLFPVIKGFFLTFFLSVYYFFKNELFTSIILLIITIILLLINQFFDNLFTIKKGVNPFIFLIGLILGFKVLGFFGLITGPVLAGMFQAGYETFYHKNG